MGEVTADYPNLFVATRRDIKLLQIKQFTAIFILQVLVLSGLITEWRSILLFISLSSLNQSTLFNGGF